MVDGEQSDFVKINEAIRLMCAVNVGPLQTSFLCQSVSVLHPPAPECVSPTTPLEEVVKTLRAKKVGAVLIVDEHRKILGIFSERDFILKVALEYETVKNAPIATFMTPDPIVQTGECTVAHVLNLMSLGGFRNLPIVDDQGVAIAMLSVRDLLDYIVHSFTDALLTFETSEG